MQTNLLSGRFGSLLVSLPILALVACSSSGPKTQEIDNALLAELSDEARVPIATARSARDEANDAMAAAAKELKDAPARLKMGKANLDSESAALAKAKLAGEYARTSGTPEDVTVAEKEYEYQMARVEAAKMQVELGKREYDLAKASNKMAEKSVDLADAKVEAAKARAVHNLNLASTREIDPNTYQGMVEKQTKALDKLRQAVADKKAGIKEMRGQVEALQSRAEKIDPR